MAQEKQLIQLEEDLRTAMIKSDVGKLKALLADDCIYVSHVGEVLDRDQDIALLETGRLKIKDIEFADRVIRCMPTCGVVSVEAKVSGSVEGKKFSGRFRYTRVWTSKAGPWQVVSAQATPLLQGA